MRRLPFDADRVDAFDLFAAAGAFAYFLAFFAAVAAALGKLSY
jgi:hypothetical protein